MPAITNGTETWPATQNRSNCACTMRLPITANARVPNRGSMRQSTTKNADPHHDEADHSHDAGGAEHLEFGLRRLEGQRASVYQ